MAQCRQAVADFSRRRSRSPDTNHGRNEITDSVYMQNGDDIVVYRKTINEVNCRHFARDIDVAIPRSSFSSHSDFLRVIPGYQLLCRSNAVNDSQMFVSTSRVGPSVIEGWGTICSISPTTVVINADGRRVSGPRALFAIDSADDHINTIVHFMAVPPIKKEGRNDHKTHSPMPLVFVAHNETAECSLVLRHRPAHWDHNARSTINNTNN